MTSIPDLWRNLAGKPGGKVLFSFLVGRFARYSGTIGARVRELKPGHSVVTMRDSPKVRNHLNSIHATAIVTLGELASGLAMMAGLPKGMRAIVTHLEVAYLKKARGILTAHGTAPIPERGEQRDYVVVATIRDAGGDEVALVSVHWLVGSDPKKTIS